AARMPAGVVLARWLYRTARYLSADAIKMNKRRQLHEQRAAATRPTETVDQTWSQVSPVLEGAMDRLPWRDRDVLLLRYFQGMDVGEVARQIGLPANSASKRLQRALDRLRSHLIARGVNAPADALSAAITAG